MTSRLVLLRQYVYFCTSKSSKLSTFVLVKQGNCVPLRLVPGASRLSFSCGYTDSGVMLSADFVCSVINEATPPSCDMNLPRGGVKQWGKKILRRGVKGKTKHQV